MTGLCGRVTALPIGSHTRTSASGTRDTRQRIAGPTAAGTEPTAAATFPPRVVAIVMGRGDLVHGYVLPASLHRMLGSAFDCFLAFDSISRTSLRPTCSLCCSSSPSLASSLSLSSFRPVV